MKSNLIKIIILCLIILPIFSHKAQKNTTNHQQNTFLIKTKLNKEQLEALLNQGADSKAFLKKEKIPENEKKIENSTSVEEVNNASNEAEDTLQEQIENEMKEDALHPLDEFQVKEVKTSETTTAFIAKAQNGAIDSLFEKRFENTYGLLLILFIFVSLIFGYVIYLGNYILKHNNKKKNDYGKIFNIDNSMEYLLFKNN